LANWCLWVTSPSGPVRALYWDRNSSGPRSAAAPTPGGSRLRSGKPDLCGRVGRTTSAFGSPFSEPGFIGSKAVCPTSFHRVRTFAGRGSAGALRARGPFNRILLPPVDRAGRPSGVVPRPQAPVACWAGRNPVVHGGGRSFQVGSSGRRPRSPAGCAGSLCRLREVTAAPCAAGPAASRGPAGSHRPLPDTDPVGHITGTRLPR